jgi:hypothetical protein
VSALHLVAVYETAVLAAQEVFEQDLQRVRQPRDLRESALLERGEAVEINGRAAGLKPATRIERIERGHP